MEMPRPAADSCAGQGYALAFARAPVGLALVGPGGDLRDVNDALCLTLGRDRAELVGAPLERFLHAADAASEPLGDALRRGGGTATIECRAERPDGSVRLLAVGGSLVPGDEGAPACSVLNAVDVTADRREREARREYLAAIDHELRTPLTSIHGYARLLSEEGRLATRLERDSVAAIERNAERMLALIERGSERLARAADEHVERHLPPPG
jgi:PAS domain S-box-containing protein